MENNLNFSHYDEKNSQSEYQLLTVFNFSSILMVLFSLLKMILGNCRHHLKKKSGKKGLLRNFPKLILNVDKIPKPKSPRVPSQKG